MPWHFPCRHWPFKPGCELGVKGSRLHRGRMWLPGKCHGCIICGRKSRSHLPNKNKVFSVYLDVEMITGEVEEGFRDVGLLTMHTAPHPHPEVHHHPRLLCLLLGQKRTCKGGVIMFPWTAKNWLYHAIYWNVSVVLMSYLYDKEDTFWHTCIRSRWGS